LSDSYVPGGQPRSVPDPDGKAYDDAMRRQRGLNAKQNAAFEQKRAQESRQDKLLGDRLFSLADDGKKTIGHPGPWESVIPIWGSGRQAFADAEDGNIAGALGNSVLAGSDVTIIKSLAGGLLKGGLKLTGPFAWRSTPWEEAGARKWLGERAFLAKGQPGHHWLFEQKSRAPNWLKNQPPFINGMANQVEHGRIHGPYTVDGVKLPRFGVVQRYLYGTPDWWKALNLSAPGHVSTAVGLSRSNRAREPHH
jgi:hypothetical protein